MGRYSQPLAPQLADLAGVQAGQRALDVGCGPGALTAELVGAPRRRRRGRRGSVRSRSSRPLVNATPASRWRCAGGRGPALRRRRLRRRARAARRVLHERSGGRAGRDAAGHARRRDRRGVRVGPRRRPGAAVAVLARGGAARPRRARRVRSAGRGGGAARRPVRGRPGSTTSRTTRSGCTPSTRRFEEWWEPYTLGVGPAGVYVAGLDASAARRAARTLPPAPGRRAGEARDARVGGAREGLGQAQQHAA